MGSGTVTEASKLKSSDDYANWEQAVHAALGEDGRIPLITKSYSELVAETEEDYPLSTTPTTQETSKRRVALRQLEKDRAAAFSTIFNSLGQTVKNNIPHNLSSFLSPDPLGLYEWLKKKYGAGNVTRMAELWSTLFGRPELMPENEDPTVTLSEMRQVSQQIVTACRGLTVEEFADVVVTNAALIRLPASYGMLASTFHAEDDQVITIEEVINRVSAEHRRRERQEITVNEHGLLARRNASFNKSVAKPATNKSGNKKVWCDNHQSGGHSTADCRGVPANWVPYKERRNDANKSSQTGASATEVNDSSKLGETIEGALLVRESPKEEYSLKAHEAALSGLINHNAIILDSGATNPFIRDKHLLSNLVKLDEPVPISVGNGAKVMATHTGRLSFKDAHFERAYYVPDMTFNLLSAKRLGTPQMGMEWRMSLRGARLVDKANKVVL